MKKILFAGLLGASMVSAGAVYAGQWVEPINGTVSAIMTPDGAVMMKVEIPPKEYAVITGMMKSGKNTCTIIPSSTNGLPQAIILICGSTREYLQGY